MFRSLFLLCVPFFAISSASDVKGPPVELKARLGKDGKTIYFELEPGQLEYEGLSEFLSSLSALGRDDGTEVSPSPKKREADLSAQRKADRTELPLFPKKREADTPKRDEAQFVLKVNPAAPRNPMPVKNYSHEQCKESKLWCLPLQTPTPKVCPPDDTPPPSPSTCGPRKPASIEYLHDFCDPFFSNLTPPPVGDNCADCQVTQKTTTQFYSCFSVPAPTALQRLKYCNPTTIPCHNIPCTYRIAQTEPSVPPPTPPPCDAGNGKSRLSGVSQLRPDSKYYILVKRSPGSWRRKRTVPRRRRFRIITDNDR